MEAKPHLAARQRAGLTLCPVVQYWLDMGGPSTVSSVEPPLISKPRLHPGRVLPGSYQPLSSSKPSRLWIGGQPPMTFIAGRLLIVLVLASV